MTSRVRRPDVLARTTERRAHIIAIAALAGLLIEATFVLLNWQRGYHAPVPAQLGVAAACALTLVMVQRGHVNVAAHVLFACTLAGAATIAVATGHADRLSPWWPVFIVGAALAFERRREVVFWSSVTFTVAMTVVLTADNAPFDNFAASVGAAIVVAGMIAAQDAGRRRLLSADLERSLAEIRTLEGLLPVCATCHHIRDEAGAWQRIDSYLNVQTGVQVSHGLCPSCAKVHYGMTDEQIAEAEAEQRGAE